MAHALSHTTSKEFAKLANLLEQARNLARKLSRESLTNTLLPIPELKRPKHIPKEDEWFWTPEWQAGEREANEALLRGDYVEFDNAQDAIAGLHRGL
jgi:hypothetical protein